MFDQGISPDGYHHDQWLPAPNGSTKPNRNCQAADGTSPSDALERMNERYCVVCDGGKTRVLSFEPEVQKDHTRLVPAFLTFQDFRNFYINKTVRLPGRKDTSLGHWWLKHPDRRQYDGLTF